MMKIFINIFGVNFGNKWDKISEDIAKKIHTWNRVKLS